MTIYFAIVIGLLTIAMIVLAVVAIRVLAQLSRALQVLDEPVGQLPKLIDNAARTSSEVRELVVKLESIVEHLRTPALHLETLTNRAAAISSSLFDEIERPVKNLASVVLGVRSGLSCLKDRWGRRSSASSRNGEAAEQEM